MLVQNFGGQTKCIMGNVETANGKILVSKNCPIIVECVMSVLLTEQVAIVMVYPVKNIFVFAIRANNSKHKPIFIMEKNE